MQRIKLSPLWHHLFKNHDTAANKTDGRYTAETRQYTPIWWRQIIYSVVEVTASFMEELNHLQVNYRSGEVSLLVTTIRGDQYFCDSRSWTSNPWEIKLQQKIAHLLAFTPSLEQCTKSTPDWTSTKSHGGCKHPYIHILIKTKKPWYGCCMLDLSSTFIGYYTLGINYPCASQYAEYYLEVAGWCTWSPRVVS